MRTRVSHVAKLLVIAPTCDGDDVGEAWVAHQWATGLAARHDVTLLTYHKRGRRPAAEQVAGARVVEWVEPAVLGRFERLNSLLKPGYVPFHVKAHRWIRQALADGERFDAAFQPTPVAMRYPSPATGTGLPLILGPVGGGLSDPPGFRGSAASTPWYVRLRALDSLRLRRDPLLRRTYLEAWCVLGIAPYVREHLREMPLRRFELMCETGLVHLPSVDLPRTPPTGELRLLFVGRLVKTKGARYAIEALARMRDLPLRLVLVGEGPDRDHCQDLVRELDLGDRVELRGFLSREAVDACYRDADVFVFPSYREPGGNVAWEAMSHGLPVITCDRGGPGESVDATSGLKLALSTEEQLIEDLAEAVRGLHEDRQRIVELGAGARRRAETHGMWSSRYDQLDQLVLEIAPRP